jgi:hypothetical protein
MPADAMSEHRKRKHISEVKDDDDAVYDLGNVNDNGADRPSTGNSINLDAATDTVLLMLAQFYRNEIHK